MSKVLLISANLATAPYPVYPLGMAVLASALKSASHEVVQADLLMAGGRFQNIRPVIEEWPPDFIGISLRNIDNVDSFTSSQEWYLDGIKLLVQQVREVCSMPIIFGGPGFSLMPDEILNYTGADYGVVGEGEQACCRLLDTLKAGRKAERILSDTQIPLSGDQIRQPHWEKKLVEFYLDASAMVNIQTKRGCPLSCIYCSYPRIEGAAYRFRDPRAVVDDIERLQRDFGVAAIFWADAVVNDLGGHCLEVAEEMLRRRVHIAWYGFFRPAGLTRSQLAILKRSGLGAMEVGTDAATDDTLAGLRKGFSFEDVLAFHEACVQLQIPVAHYIIFGGPDETAQTLKAGLENLKRLKRSVIFAFSGIRIHPGTPLAAIASQQGILSASDDLLRPVYYVSPAIEKTKMDEAICKTFRNRRNSFFPPSEGLLRLGVMKRFGFKGLLWDKLITFT